MNNRIAFCVWSGMITVLLCAGCGGQRLPADLPPLHPTVLTITQGGAPLADAVVGAVNVDETILWSGAAVTDASGRATMLTNGMYRGLPEGTWKITVVKHIRYPEGPTTSLLDEAPDINVDAAAHFAWVAANRARIDAEARERSRMEPQTYELVDPLLGSSQTTTLEVTITRGRNQHTLDVGEAVRVPYAGRR